MSIWAIVPAAGIGLRLGSTTPKQYLPLLGKPVLLHSLERLAAITGSDFILESILIPVHHQDRWHQELPIADLPVEFVPGGAERRESVMNALYALKDRAADEDWVLVHDAVRPCVRPGDIQLLLNKVAAHDCGGLLGAPVVSTLKRVDDTGHVEATIERKNCWQAHTPQVFRYGLLRQSLEQACTKTAAITDEASAIEAAGHSPLLVEGDHLNIKITHESDLKLAELILQQQESNHES